MIDVKLFYYCLDKAGLTMTELADRMGWTRPYLYAQLRRKTLGSDIIEELRRHMNIPEDIAEAVFFSQWVESRRTQRKKRKDNNNEQRNI